MATTAVKERGRKTVGRGWVNLYKPILIQPQKRYGTIGRNNGQMKILVFGKNGQVAKELSRFPDVINLGRDQADFVSPQACIDAITCLRPDAIINAAAYTAVDLAEDEEDLATQINGKTPGLIAETASKLNIPFVHISTDYVFSGSGDTPWKTDAPTEPLGAYGRSKLEGERLVGLANKKAIILRTSWVFSPHGNNFVKTMLRLAETRNELNIIADQIGNPTPASEIARACHKLAHKLILGSIGGTYHFSGIPSVTWAGFAREIFKIAQLDMVIKDISTEDYPTKAQRPQNSMLDCSELEREFGIVGPKWKVALADVIGEMKA